MDSKAQLTADTIAKVVEGKIDVVNAAKLLNRSRRTIERYLQRYRAIGIQFVVHQNTGKSAYNKTCGKTKRKVQTLIKKKYFDLNLLTWVRCLKLMKVSASSEKPFVAGLMRFIM